MTTMAVVRYRKRYHSGMGMNIRMDEELAAGLRGLSERTGRSQQDLVRQAIDEFVRTFELREFPAEIRHTLTPARRPYRRLVPSIELTCTPEELQAAFDWQRSDRFEDR
mgnify:CR=1 FL=1